jgi:hypothetical protein
MMKELPKKGLGMLTCIYNAMLKLNFWPKQLKTAENILIPKPGKNPKELSSYRPVSLFPIISKLFEKFILRRINMDMFVIIQVQAVWKIARSYLKLIRNIINFLDRIRVGIIL